MENRNMDIESRLEILRVFYDTNPYCFVEEDSGGNTALNYTIRRSQQEIVKFLVENHMVQVDRTNNGDEYPLTEAISLRFNVDILEEMIKAGANVNYRSKNGVTPLRAAGIHFYSEATTLLRRYGAKDEGERK